MWLIGDCLTFVCDSSIYLFLLKKKHIQFQVLLVTSSRRPDNWIVPGGGVEPNEEPACTAVREVLEEAGVIGALGRCLGMFEVSVFRSHAHPHTNLS